MPRKLAMLPVLLALGCLIAGAYGALHNQISYTVSPDYFHEFKFRQFSIPEGLRSRLGAAVVGWQASWWMGLIIGVPVLLVGLIMPDWKSYGSRSMIAYGVVAATTLGVGLLALAWASVAITPGNVGVPTTGPLSSPGRMVAFRRAGTMHNFSYIGGFLGILTGTGSLLAARVRLSRRDPAHHVSAKVQRTVLGGLLMVGAFAVISVLLFAYHLIPGLNTDSMELTALVGSEAVGLVGVLMLPIRRIWRLLLSIVYGLVMYYLLSLYGVLFLMMMFG